MIDMMDRPAEVTLRAPGVQVPALAFELASPVPRVDVYAAPLRATITGMTAQDAVIRLFAVVGSTRVLAGSGLVRGVPDWSISADHMLAQKWEVTVESSSAPQDGASCAISAVASPVVGGDIWLPSPLTGTLAVSHLAATRGPLMRTRDGVTVQAHPDNPAAVEVGGSNVAAAGGLVLSPGMWIHLPVRDASDVFFKAAAAGCSVRWMVHP